MAKDGTADRPEWPRFPHEALAVVLSVRGGRLSVLMWQRARPPHARRWALPGGILAPDERLRESLQRHLAEKVALRDIAYLEQLETHSATKRDPRERVLATGYLGIVATDVEPELPADTAWLPVDALPPTAMDHHFFVTAGIDRLRAKLSYTNIGFALVPPEFTLSLLRDVISAALGYSVHPTNLARVMTRRHLIEPTGTVSAPGPGGGRPAMVYRFRSRELLVTDPFAVLRPPGRKR
ncbi:MAG TPA: NUDIX domain-containing protein [Mycobacteriales bacterium]|nr:NUDIX domain-containing protein [Mycobacteriales bacterium]